MKPVTPETFDKALSKVHRRMSRITPGTLMGNPTSVAPPSPPGPLKTLLSWWKGEDNLVDSTDGNDLSVTIDSALYDDGIVGRCFRFIPGSPYHNVLRVNNIIINSSLKFAYEFYVKMRSPNNQIWPFRLVDYNGTEIDFCITGPSITLAIVYQGNYAEQTYTDCLNVSDWNQVYVEFDPVTGKLDVYLFSGGVYVKLVPDNYVPIQLDLINPFQKIMLGGGAYIWNDGDYLLDEIKIYTWA